MSIANNNIITWADITTSVINSIKSVCCNIDGFAANIPADLKSGTASNPAVWTYTTTQGSTNYGHGYGTQWQSQTFTFNANNTTNLIYTVTTATVTSEWSTFLSAAGADARSNKVIQAHDFGLAMGLVVQFMAYHLKKVYSRRQILGGALFQGTKYVAGTVGNTPLTPKYVLSGINPSSIPDVTNADITALIRQNIVNDGSGWGIISSNENPVAHRIYLN